MPYDVEYTHEFETWWDELSARTQNDVSRVVDMLVEHGPLLPDPYSSGVNQSRHGRMRELRIQSGGRPIRVFYAFDPRRTALLLLGAYKTHPRRFYDDYVPRADLIYDRHLKELLRERPNRSYEPSAMTPRPWSELTKHWSPERKAANERAKAELRADIRRLQAQARQEGRHPGDPPSPGSSSRSPQTPIDPVESHRQPARDVERDFGPSR